MKHTVLICIISVLFFPAYGQEEESYNILKIPLFLTEANAEHPIGIFSLDLPFYFPKTATEKHRISFGYSMGNIWAPTTRLVYPLEMSDYQKNAVREIFFADRPAWFDSEGIETLEKVYQGDGVLNHFRLTWLSRWKEKNSMIVNMNLHFFTGGRSPVNFFVSDRFIEWFHTICGVDDHYGRKQYPFNRAVIGFTDEDGYGFRPRKGDIFTSVLDMHYYRRLYNRTTDLSAVDLHVGAHLSIPVNAFHPYFIPGISGGICYDVRLGQRSSFTAALDGGLTDQTFIKTGHGVKGIDWRYRKLTRLYLGVNSLSGKKNIFTVGVLNTYSDPLMEGGAFNRIQTGYKELGVMFLQEGDIWNEQRVNGEFKNPHLGAASLYYYGIKTYVVLGFHKRGREFTLYISEDIISKDNAPDFQLGFQYSISLKR